MDLDRISVKARPRNPWEAIDLGFVLARRWWKSLFLSWMIPPLLLFIACSLIFIDSPWAAYLIVWWLKPFWDRAPLYIASHALFGERVTVTQVLRQLPVLYRKDCIAWLTWRRLSPSRSFDMPVTILESLTGGPRTSRLRVLHYASGSAASWLTIICVHLEVIVSMGIIGMVFWMVPEQLEFDWQDAAFYEQLLPLHINNLLMFIGMALIAPFYTMAGFALYISRRIDLEAWDIEIRFRHLAALQRRGSGLLVSLFFVTGITLLLLSPPMAIAQGDASGVEMLQQQDANITAEIRTSPSARQREAKTAIDHILEGEAFHLQKDVSSWRLKEWEDEEERRELLPEWLIDVIEFFERNSGSFDSAREFVSSSARVLEFMLWVFVVSLFIYFFYRYREQLRNFIDSQGSGGDEAEKAVPEVLFGLDVRRESLPDDVPAQVQQLWANSEPRVALSLLYRATLSSLIHNYNFKFFDGDTEGECVVTVRARGDERLSDYTQRLTLCWQQLAYGHQLPESELVNALCDQWRQVFQHEQ